MDEYLFSDPTQTSTAEIQLKMHTLLTCFLVEVLHYYLV